MTQHTPGPWEAVLSRDKQWRIWSRAYAEEELLLAPWDPKAEENARLMAAAPGLLAALDDAIRQFEGHGLFVCADKARAAIARATGEAS